MLSAQLGAATYYVDYAAGADTNLGTSATSAWKHCPGDPAATATAGAMTLTPGDTVLFKGGVTYVLTGSTGIVVRWSGAPSSPITYDGNSAGTFGSGRARITDNHGDAARTAFAATSAVSHLSFKNLEFAGIGGSATLPADAGAPVAPRFGGGIGFPAGVSHTTIEGCVFTNLGYAFNQKPMAATSLAGTGILLGTTNSVTISKCDFSRMNLGVGLSGSTTPINLTIANCTFHDGVVWPFDADLNGGALIHSSSVSNNTQFDRAAWTGYGADPRSSTRTVSPGASVTFSASAAAIPNATYQWRKNGTPIAAATSPTLMLPAVSATDAGSYTVSATNSHGTATSHEMILVVSGTTEESKDAIPQPSTGVAPVFTKHPTSQTAVASTQVTFSVEVTGTPMPTIRWYRNGTTFPSWTGPTLTLKSVTGNDVGTYVAVATNEAGEVTSNAATFKLATTPTDAAPAFTLHPVSQTVAAASSATFSVAVTGSPAPTVRWYRDGVTQTGWTGTTLTLNSVSTADAGKYVAVATSSAGEATSNAATLTLAPTDTAPVFTKHPVNQTSAQGSSVTFSVEVTGSPAPTIRWYRNGITSDAWTGSTLTLKSISSSDAGTYVAVATNTAGKATSNSATLTVAVPSTPPPPPPPATAAPAFTTHPISQSVKTGSSVTLTVAVTGSPTPAIRWYRNGITFSSWTGTTLKLSSFTSNDVGTYIAVATNSAGTATSNSAKLSLATTATPPPTTPVNVAPAFTTHPVSQVAAQLSSVTFTVAVTGTPEPTIRWYRNGITFSSWTGPTLKLASVTSNDVGTYVAIATNEAGTVTSNSATLKLASTPSSAAQHIVEGDSATEAPTSPEALGSRLVNLSVRGPAGSGDDAMIVGFVVAGDSNKSLLIRGSGPALANFGVPGVLSDPTLALYSGAKLLAMNDDWASSPDADLIAPRAAQAGAFALPEGSRDAALLADISAGAYTGQVTGKDSDSGVALIELYDTAPNSRARLVNLSVRTRIKVGDESPAIGFVVTGTSAKTLLVRAVGPSLESFGVTGTLANPQIEIYENSSRLAQNDDWSGTPELEASFRHVGAFPLTAADSKDAALVFTAQPGAYTAVVSGVDGGAGTVLVEVYEIF